MQVIFHFFKQFLEQVSATTTRLDFMPITDFEQSVRDDLAEYKQYPMLNQNVTVRRFFYDTKSGLLKEIK